MEQLPGVHPTSSAGSQGSAEALFSEFVKPHWAIRGRCLGNKISDKRAEDALAAVSAATIDLVETTALLPRMWELRSNITGYDAAYIATAEAYDCALVTADRRLTGAPGIGCAVILAVG